MAEEIVSTSLFDAALEYAASGIPVFRAEANKRPFVKEWPQAALAVGETREAALV